MVVGVGSVVVQYGTGTVQVVVYSTEKERLYSEVCVKCVHIYIRVVLMYILSHASVLSGIRLSDFRR